MLLCHRAVFRRRSNENTRRQCNRFLQIGTSGKGPDRRHRIEGDHMRNPITITQVTPRDIRFPTSDSLLGSDAMNPAPDYSATYVVLSTDDPELEGYGLTFTIGRGNEICVAAVKALEPLLVGKTLESFTADMAGFWSMITGDSQLRWLGPEKGVIHLATAAVVNAVWDLYARSEGKPLWRLLADMSPAELVSCVDF